MAMALASPASASASASESSSSSLNPNAPYFFPASFSAAEDFSPHWWHLVQTCPAFREYWLTERFDPELLLAPDDALDPDSFPDLDFEDADLEENMPPLSASLDFKEFTEKTGLKESIGGSRQNKHEYSPLPYQAKPLKVAHPQKPTVRKIQQPR